MRFRFVVAAVGALGALAVGMAWRPGRVRRVGDVTPQGTLVASGDLVAARGRTATLSAAVVDGVVSGDGRRVLIKTSTSVAVFSLQAGKVVAVAPIEGGASMTGIAVSPSGRTVAVSSAGDSIDLYTLSRDSLKLAKRVHLPAALVGGPAYPCGLAFAGPGRLLVAASRDNSLLDVSLAGPTIHRMAIDPAPYSVTVSGSRAYVTCWAGQLSKGRPTASSAGTMVEVDARGIGTGGSVCEVNLDADRPVSRVRVPQQPTEMALGDGKLFVACANGDAIVELDPQTLAERGLITLPNRRDVAPNSLALDDKGRRLLVAFGALDRIGAYDLAARRWAGFERTAWYPSLVRMTGDRLVVGTAKGFGDRGATGLKHSVGDLTATLSVVDHPQFRAHVPPASVDEPPRPGAAPRPIPARTGEPSPIKHVVYVIKENRTYDQVLGDMKEGDGDARLAMYGVRVTPNHHAIATDFVLLDNYYCNGMISSDGHAWATESNATTYYERSRGGWTRSYPFGDDPLATSDTGYLWDDAVSHGRTVRNFGEFDYATPRGVAGAFTILHGFERGKPFKFSQNIGVADLRAMSDPTYPGWNLAIPDVLRASRFKSALHTMSVKGTMPDLTVVYLPQDHTSGGAAGYPSPRAQVADNDLALGRVVEAISHSRFWATTAIFIEEDDPQDGFDHVDGYRSLCLIASPYARRGVRISTFYNQCSVLHTIERILGLPPMNMNDAEAPVMTDCFTSRPNLKPYAALPNRIRLDEVTPVKQPLAFDLSHPDSVDDDVFNRRLWALSGMGGPYPAALTRHRREP